MGGLALLAYAIEKPGHIRRLVLVGTGSGGPACLEELAAGIQHAQLRSFERSGHYPFIEEADAFWRAVGGFLGNTPYVLA